MNVKSGNKCTDISKKSKINEIYKKSIKVHSYFDFLLREMKQVIIYDITTYIKHNKIFFWNFKLQQFC